MKIFKITSILIGIIIISWIYYLHLNLIIFSKKEVYVPDIVGLDEDKEKEIIEQTSLGYSIAYVNGIGFAVKLYIYNNEKLHYESFVGSLYENIANYLEEYCSKYLISYEVTYTINNSLPEGVIINQNFSTIDDINEGEVIKLEVSANDSFLLMPSLTGMNVYDDIKLLNENNLSFNLIYYSLIDENLVLSQSIPPLKVIKKGNKSVIDIYISKGIPNDLSRTSKELIASLKYIDNYEIVYVASEIKNNVIKIISYNNNGLYYKIYIKK